MTYGEILAKNNLSFVGFWDCCFFNHNCKSGGLMVVNDKGEKKDITWEEFYKMAERAEKDKDNE